MSYSYSTLWESGSRSWQWITHAEILTLNEDMLTSQVSVKISHCMEEQVLSNIQLRWLIYLMS